MKKYVHLLLTLFLLSHSIHNFGMLSRFARPLVTRETLSRLGATNPNMPFLRTPSYTPQPFYQPYSQKTSPLQLQAPTIPVTQRPAYTGIMQKKPTPMMPSWPSVAGVGTRSWPSRLLHSQPKSSPSAMLTLVEAIKGGSTEDLNALIRKGLINLHTRFEGGKTIMHIAAEYAKNPEIFFVLHNAGADSNAKDDRGKTPLHLASSRENPEAAKALLTYGAANPNIPDSDGKVPLYHLQEQIYLSKDAKEVMKILEPFTNNSSWMPGANLHRAVLSNDLSTVERLLNQDPSMVNTRYRNNNTILHLAVDYDVSPKILPVLLKAHADINAQNKFGETPLHRAAQSNNERAIRTLLDHGADPNISSNIGKKTPLLVALNNWPKPNEKIVRMLEAVTDTPSPQAQTIDPEELKQELTSAINFSERLKYLLSTYQVDQSTLNDLLYKAADSYSPRPDAIKILIKTGADINTQKGWYKQTPLHRAVSNRHLDIVKMLLEHGANPNIVDEDGKAPLRIAQEQTYATEKTHKIIKLLKPMTNRSLWLEVTPEIELRSIIGDLNIDNASQLKKLKQLLSTHTFDKAVLSEQLYRIADSIFTRPDLMRPLLEAGADVNTKQGWYNQTPLHRAAFYAHPEVIKLLLQYNANPNIVDEEERSALFIVQKEDYQTKKTHEIIKLLEPITDRSLWFEITPEIDLFRAIKHGASSEEIKRLLGTTQTFETAVPEDDLPASSQPKKVLGLIEALKMARNKKPVLEILGVGTDASPDDIKKAYRRFLMEHHPDMYKKDKDKYDLATDLIKYIHSEPLDDLMEKRRS